MTDELATDHPDIVAIRAASRRLHARADGVTASWYRMATDELATWLDDIADRASGPTGLVPPTLYRDVYLGAAFARAFLAQPYAPTGGR